MPDIYLLHRFIRKLANVASQTFFREVHVIGEEYVPKDGPVIVVATHHNMMLDPAVLSTGVPHGRILHYWSKASLYANPVLKYILLSTGNIPVERKSKDRRVLFKGTFEALAKDEVVALFPEGTSYTEPNIAQVKDGSSWAMMEYCKWAKEGNKEPGFKPAVIVPAAMVYTNKSKYRSSVILEFSPPITPDAYLEEFFSNDPEGPRLAVKEVTKAIEKAFIETTVNAPDWDTMYSARMARDILWENEQSLNLDEFVAVSQTLVDLFTTPDLVPDINSIKLALLEYYSLLQSTHLTHSVLSNLPLDKSLDPRKQNISLPSRLYTIALLVKDTLVSLAHLPFFALPLFVHLPVYFMACYGATLAADEEESQAQNKVIFSMLAMLMAYPALFFFLWALLYFTPFAAAIAAGLVGLVAYYHTTVIDVNYEHAKRLIAAWRVLVGVWSPERVAFSMPALSQYTTPITPGENPWLDKYKNAAAKAEEKLSSLKAEIDAHAEKHPVVPVLPPAPALVAPQQREPRVSIPKSGKKPNRRPPSRRIMRHVLRARVKAIRALARLFDDLAKQDRHAKVKGASKQRIAASEHLGKKYGGILDIPLDEHAEQVKRGGWRDFDEVLAYLQARGAKIPTVTVRGSQAIHSSEDDWAGLSSGDEGLTTDTEEQDEPVWVKPGE